MGFYGDAEGDEGGNGVVQDVPAAAHYGDGGSMLSKLGGNLEADTGAATGEQSYFAFEYIGLEWRLHFSGYMYNCFQIRRRGRVMIERGREQLKLRRQSKTVSRSLDDWSAGFYCPLGVGSCLLDSCCVL